MATIFVELLDEGVDCWCPVEAERLDEKRFRILDSAPEGERWAFNKGDVVHCCWQTNQGDHALGAFVLCAFELAEAES